MGSPTSFKPEFAEQPATRGVVVAVSAKPSRDIHVSSDHGQIILTFCSGMVLDMVEADYGAGVSWIVPRDVLAALTQQMGSA